MGTFGPGLYSNDYAADLKVTIAAVVRLPYGADRLLELLTTIEEPATRPDDEDYTTFWLVVADQFHKRGIPSEAQAHARAIIADGSDVAMLRELGMADADLRKRSKNLLKLDAVLAGDTPTKKRTVLRAPQPLLLERGAVFRYPIDSQGSSVNPYMNERDLERFPFIPVGWGAITVVGIGHALDYLAWYQIARSPRPWRDAPTITDALSAIDVLRNRVGTLSFSHVQRLRLEHLGVDSRQAPPPLDKDTIRTTAANISASNSLSESKPVGTYPNDTMLRLQESSLSGRLTKLFRRSTAKQ